MNATPLDFLAFLEQQRVEYRALLPARLLQIESLWRQVLNGDSPVQAMATLERCAHSLAGSGATFGCAALGDAARSLELAVNSFLDTADILTSQSQTELSRLVEALKSSISSAS